VHGENDQDTGYQPGRSPETVEMEKLLQSLRLKGADCPIDPGLSAGQVVAEVEGQVEAAEKSVFDGATLKDLVMRRMEKGGEAREG
jgi:hypothetical protein